jgi:predicted PurR-regulated permease PerM
MKENQDKHSTDISGKESEEKVQLKFNPVIHSTLQLLALGLLLYWTFRIIEPFITLAIWGTVIAIAFYPTHLALTKRLGGRQYWSAGILSLVMIAVIVAPAIWLLLSTVHEFNSLADLYKEGSIAIKQPSESIKSWPIVGTKLYELWMKASTNMNDLIVEHADTLKQVALYVFELLANTGKAVFMFFFSILISGAMLAFSEPVKVLMKKVLGKLIGAAGESYGRIANTTVRSVTRGVLGVALIQSILAGIGMVVAGIPFAGLWIVICVILSIVQIGVFPVSIGVVIYIWTTGDTLTASLLTGWMAIVGVSDNILKPFMLGKSEVPMPIVFVGSIGGFLFSGFIGLFTGAIVLALFYKLFNAWLETPNK